METPATFPATPGELKERFLRARELKQPVHWEKIVKCLQQWAAALEIGVQTIVRVEGAEQFRKAGKLANAVLAAAREAVLVKTTANIKSLGADKALSFARRAASLTAQRAGCVLDAGSLAWVDGAMMTVRRESADNAAWANSISRASTTAGFITAKSAWETWTQTRLRGNSATRAARSVMTGWEFGDVAWLSVTAIRAAEFGNIVGFRNWYPMFEAFEAGAFCFFLTDNRIEVCTIPSAVREDGRRRLHCESGPAFEWLNDIRDFYLHDVKVEPYVVENPGRITVYDIEAERNIEVRRIKIERFGQTRYILDSGAQEIHQDECGTLFRKELPGDEPLVLVKVVNSTPEPDGSFKEYFLRVPPAIQTAREAVAWTFGKTSANYAPEKET